MKTSKILLILLCAILFFMGLAFYNLVINNSRSFKMISFKQFDICFLVSSDYKLEQTVKGFKYKLKNNFGEFKVLKRSMSKGLVMANISGVEVGYKKLKNDRIFEYKLDDSTTLLDTFYIIKKRQTNLVPLKDKCEELLKLYPTVMEIN